MKKRIAAIISIHYIQADIITALQVDRIDFKKHSLREIATIIKAKECSPQKIKHHLEQLVKLGAIQIINAEYFYDKSLPPKITN